MTVTVAVIDNDPWALRAVQQVLAQHSSEILVVAVGASVEDLLAAHHSPVPQVVVLDVMLGPHGGPLAANIARLRGWGTHVLAISAEPERREVVEAVHRQRVSFLPKDDLADEHALLAAIRDTAAGKMVVSPQFVTECLLGNERDSPKLTAREEQVMRLRAGGMTPKQVARRLDIREDTVRNHLAAVLDKYRKAGRPVDNPVALHYAALHDEIITDPFEDLGARPDPGPTP